MCRMELKWHRESLPPLLLLLWVFARETRAMEPCRLSRGRALSGIVKNAEIILGGLFPVHSGIEDVVQNFTEPPKFPKCINFDPRALRWALTMVYTIEKINQNPHILPNITLGYIIYDSCYVVPKALEASLAFVRRRAWPNAKGDDVCTPHAIIGSSESTISVTVARLFGLFYVPQVSYHSTCKCLSDKVQFPSFQRTVPSHAYQASTMKLVVLHFDWAFVGVLGSDNDYGHNGISQFVSEAEQEGTCIAFRETMPKDFDADDLVRFGDLLNETKAKVLLVFSNEAEFLPLALEAVRRNVTGKIWLATETWVTSSTLSSPEYAPSFKGSIGLALRRGEIPGLEEFLLKIRPGKKLQDMSPVSSNVRLHKRDLNDPGKSITRQALLRFQREVREDRNIRSSNSTTDTVTATSSATTNTTNSEYTDMNNSSATDSGISTTVSSGDLSTSLGFLTSAVTTALSTSNPSDALDRDDSSLDAFVKRLWEITFNCTWHQGKYKKCLGNETLEGVNTPFTDVLDMRVTYNTHMAVLSVAHAMHDLQQCTDEEGPFINNTCADIMDFAPWQLLYYMRHVTFVNINETMKFDDSGDPPALYEVINWQPVGNHIEFEQVGFYDHTLDVDDRLQIDNNSIVWPANETKIPRSICSESCIAGTRKGARKGEPFCCFDCIPCTDGEFSNVSDSRECFRCDDELWSNTDRTFCVPKFEEYLAYLEAISLVLLAFAMVGVVITIAIGLLMYRNRELPIVKATNREISGLLLVGLVGCLSTSVAFMGKPTSPSCRLREVVSCASLSLAVSCVLSKTVQVIIAFRATMPGSSLRAYLGAGPQRVLVSTCFAPQLAYCLTWGIAGYSVPYRNKESRLGIIVLECGLASPIWPAGSLAYIALQAVICFVLAFMARKLPSAFNEAKFITFSMLVTFLVWLAFVPAYVSTRGKFAVATEVFAVVASAYGLLGCIFLPKVYVILFKTSKAKGKSVASRTTTQSQPTEISAVASSSSG
uniref:extracellular calcium-sensing receptor-like n=1 Tax=Myxine glutinosa TaxID=7769 RepID=UPI00358F0633